MNKSWQERFWEKVHLDTPDKCWIWNGATNKNGYGTFRLGRVESTNRVAFLARNGRFPHRFACHTCDIKACVKPDHIYDGTNQTNMLDAVVRMRNHNVKKSSCVHGHSLEGENLIVLSRKDGRTYRGCRACRKATSQKYEATNRVR